jgi:hypothetical protein
MFAAEDVQAAAETSPPAAPVAIRPTVELSGALTDEDKEFIDEHLAEGKVFRKYGLVDKAADQFEAVIARFPDHVEARQELRDVYRDKWFDFGISNDARGLNAGLMRNKEGFGASAVVHDRYVLEVA